jgi:predicted transcriptional regulator
MATAKQVVLDLLESLPDDCSLEDITYELYVRQAIAQGEREADTGRLVPHDEVLRQARKCLER